MTTASNETGKQDFDGLDWKEGNVPVSRRFGDPYYSVVDGRAETGHVFIRGNGLTHRWPDMSVCRIGELGFGTGLNFLETLRQWRETRRPGARLEYFSFEMFPLERQDMETALAPWPDLSPFAALLVANWECGTEMLSLEFDPDAQLTVYFGDANMLLPRLEFQADAWYLDGFAPAKNPEMWNSSLLHSVFEHTRPGGRFATYTAAGWVRRNLADAGFEVERAPGFGTKREMLHGHKPLAEKPKG